MTATRPASLEHIGRRALSSAATLQATYDLAALCIKHGIPGDFVECGVFQGVQCAAMAKACMDLGVTDRRVHLFDTFSGIPQAGPKDLEYLAAGHKAGLSAASLEDVQGNMEEWGIDPELLVYHEGLFAHTVPIAMMLGSAPAEVDGFQFVVECGDIKRIALLRLDGDLYESTKDCLPLVKLVSPGGWIIADDFHLSGCREAIAEGIGWPGPVYWRA